MLFPKNIYLYVTINDFVPYMALADIALTMTPGIGVKGAVHLLEVFHDAQSIFEAGEAELVQRAELRPDLARQIVRRTGFTAAERELSHCMRQEIQAIASTDPAYPKLLRETPDYPPVLYVKGSVSILSAPCVAMVGTREATPYGLRMCNELIRPLTERVPHVCVVSGLAFGIDAACHRAALAAGAKTAAVLPSPLPGIVPTQHTRLADEILAAGGALVTELHSQVKQKGTFYVNRNRIIAGLSAGTIVIESPCGGGSLVTAGYADGYNRPVMAVPGRTTDPASRGTNLLIRNRKAQLVLSEADVIEELMWDLELPGVQARSKRSLPEFTAAEAALLACLPPSDPLSADELAIRSGCSAADLAVLLLDLEMAGAVRQLPGNQYLKTI